MPYVAHLMGISHKEPPLWHGHANRYLIPSNPAHRKSILLSKIRIGSKTDRTSALSTEWRYVPVSYINGASDLGCVVSSCERLIINLSPLKAVQWMGKILAMAVTE